LLQFLNQNLCHAIEFDQLPLLKFDVIAADIAVQETGKAGKQPGFAPKSDMKPR
jgi:hypothetical protein